jgi:hypothetical protein
VIAIPKTQGCNGGVLSGLAQDGVVNWLEQSDPTTGLPNVSLLLFGAAALILFSTPKGYYQVRDKRTKKRIGPRMYHY